MLGWLFPGTPRRPGHRRVVTATASGDEEHKESSTPQQALPKENKRSGRRASSTTSNLSNSGSRTTVESTSPQVAPEPLVEGSEGRWRMLRVLKQSLFGAVVLAVDEEQGERKVVVKMSQKSCHQQGVTRRVQTEVVENVVMEAHMWKKIQDTGKLPQFKHIPGFRFICKLERFAANQEHYLTIMEHCSGGDLFDKLEADGPFPGDLAQSIFSQVCLGMEAIHAAGVCHMDLSLENVLLTADGEVRICDFGVAREFKTDQLDKIRGRTRPGKDKYMAPEVYEFDYFDGRLADMWSMGVVLFVLLTGLQPFLRPSRKDQVYNIIMDGFLHRVLKGWGFTWDGASSSSNSSAGDSLVELPAGAVDLMFKLLQPRTQRLTLAETLQHPWLAGQVRLITQKLRAEALVKEGGTGGDAMDVSSL
eukprot:gb/GEZN01005437.1/.p1 GENE.gb/GEZN01005437.1/~~gb/GEZN01005437.1/.p1  ORF type:complete len:419 (+),score=43.96 gb/GEZN01005437.1/:123-1379(+)